MTFTVIEKKITSPCCYDNKGCKNILCKMEQEQ